MSILWLNPGTGEYVSGPSSVDDVVGIGSLLSGSYGATHNELPWVWHRFHGGIASAGYFATYVGSGFSLRLVPSATVTPSNMSVGFL